MYGAGFRYTEAHDRFISSALGQGVNAGTVAKGLYRPVEGVIRRAERLGLRPRPGSAPRPFTPDQDRLIRLLAERGFSSDEVAERLGRRADITRRRARKLGVAFSRPGQSDWVGILTSEIETAR